jgi:pimeloyl-ACP methyl ester carboxylesterase/DNA-binding CsgD family transcriptional regulator
VLAQLEEQIASVGTNRRKYIARYVHAAPTRLNQACWLEVGFPGTIPIGGMQPTQVPETHYAVSGGVHIAYQTVGTGPIDLVFVMGWVTHMDYFWQEPRYARFLRRLASFSRLILLDLRGRGLSDRAVGIPTLEERLDDIRAVMDAVGSKRAAIMGVSEGGVVSMVFAATYPVRTAQLVLVGTAPRSLWAPDWSWAETQRDFDKRMLKIERDQGWGTLEWAAQDLERRAPGYVHDEDFKRWWVTYLRMGASPGAAIAITRLNSATDIRHVLPAIRVPTLILQRSGDRVTRVEASRYMAAHIAGATYFELPGDEHLPFLGDQNDILTRVEEFLGGGRATAEPDSMLATVLAMEIVERAQVMANVGERSWRDIQRAYSEIVQRALDVHRGRSVTTDSESLLATFDGPSRAIRCALTIVQQSLSLGIKPRAGLHTGECDIVEGEPGGLSFRVAAWIMAQASGGEVLASNTVRDLVSGSAIAFDDADVHATTPGPGGRWRVFRVESPYSRANAGDTRAVVPDVPRSHDSLTPREREVVGLLARGRTNREIADALIISERTVENHVSNVLGKLSLETRAQVAVWALRRDQTGVPISA